MDTFKLYKECKKNNTLAQKYLFDCYCRRWFLLCKRYVKQTEQAEEVLQNGFLKIFNHLNKFNYTSDEAFITWMSKIMVNECLQFLRTKEYFLPAITTEMEEINTVVVNDNKIELQDLYNYIVQLPIGYRIVFNLFEIEGYNHKEISQLLNVTEGTSKSQLSKAKQTLQKLITKEIGGKYASK